MANTQGMPDDVMNEILSFPQSTVSSSRPVEDVQRQLSSSTSTATATSTRMSSFLQQRMEMTTRPAATVIRRSNNPGPIPLQHASIAEEKESEWNDEKGTGQTQQHSLPTSRIIVGDIIERDVDRTAISSKTTTTPRYRSGFPSLAANQPIGIFAKKTMTKNGDSVTLPKNRLHEDKGGAGDSTECKNANADALLSQMSRIEIQEKIQELQQNMSPETLAFLKKRGQEKAAPSSTWSAQKMATTEPVELKTIELSEVTDETKEKERISNILSSIRTYDDLDEAFEREMGPEEKQQGLECKSEWDQACALLRSTSPRQNLWAARVICRELQRDVREGKGFRVGLTIVWPYPILLPVSLRCLLDANLAHTNGMVLHTFVLQSIYSLLLLRAPVEHVVDVSGTPKSAQCIHQTIFLRDDIPTPPFGSLYPSLAATPVVENKGGEAVAYATSSSTTSAQQDGEAFLKDPMWTLLSRMQLVPLISQLLNSHYKLPEEGLVAISGILAMLSIRSPGAASAIAQHSSLLRALLQQTVLPPVNGNESHFLNASVMLPVMILLNTMARQSRVVASNIPFMDILPPILAIQDDGPVEVQRWALILWRKLLRYGIGISGISSLVALAIRPLSERGILAPEYCTLFAAFLDCARVFVTKSDTRLSSAVSASDGEILFSSVAWMTPFAKQCASRVCVFGDDAEDDAALTLQAGMLRLLLSYVAAWIHSSKADDDKISQWALLVQDSQMIRNMTTFVSSAAFKKILNLLAVLTSEHNVSTEAAASCFVNELINVVTTLESLEYVEVDPSICQLGSTLRGILCEKLAGCQSTDSMIDNTHCWIKECHFAMAKLLLTDGSVPSSDRPLVRLFVLNLIGRLTLGDESKAAILLSNESIFDGDNSALSATMSALFMRELCGSESARKQLDHSYKLNRGFGLTAEGWGPFATESLLSDSDCRPGSDPGLLPMGKMWTWHLLSGSFRVEVVSEEEMNDTECIVSSSLSFLIHLEKDNETVNARFGRLPPGAKLYFLLNTLLFPESIIAIQEVQEKTDVVLEIILQQIDPSLAMEFISACYDHSRLKKNPTTADPVDAKDENLLSILSGTPNSSSKTMRSMQEFCSDLINAYIDYGVQYEIFTKAIRVLLRPQFPSQIRCDILHRIRDVSHLLTLEDESDVKGNLQKAVEAVLLKGIPPEAERDSAELLDVLSSILRLNQGGRSGFFFVFSVSTLVRALVGNMKSGTGILSMKRRILLLPLHTAMVILETYSKLMTSRATTRSHIVAATIEAWAEAPRDSGTIVTMDASTWESWLRSQQ